MTQAEINQAIANGEAARRAMIRDFFAHLFLPTPQGLRA